MQRDERFARLHSDPRFQRLPKKQRKVQVDKRFAGMFTQKQFQSGVAVDKYGRKKGAKKGAAAAAASRLFELAPEEDDEPAPPPSADADAESDLTESESLTESEGSEAGDDDDVAGSSALAAWLQQAESVPRVKEGTSRLAVVNLDWEQVRAVDILAVLRSFLPAGGAIRSVRVYLSEEGEAAQAKERAHGPQGVWAAPDAASSDDDDATERDGGAVDNERAREYELNRMRHYFGVVVCDSVATAEHLYTECDGAEFEASAMALDLRFIPDHRTFDRQPRDEASTMPAKYKSPAVLCSALTQSTVKLGWDADEKERAQMLKRDFSRGEVQEMEYSAYLASSSDDGDGDDEYEFDAAPLPPAKREGGGLRSLLGGGASEGAAENAAEGEAEMTFEVAGGKKGKKDEADLNVWEQAQLKMREKKRERRMQRLAAEGAAEGAAEAEGGAEAADGAEADPEDDPFFAASNGDDDGEVGDERAAPRRRGAAAARAPPAASGERRRRKGKKGRAKADGAGDAASERERAELELLMVGDGDGGRGYDAKALALPPEGGKRRAREKRRAEAATVGGADDGFELDVHDPRFERLFTSHEFALDPTHPKFKRTVASEGLLKEIRHRRGHADGRADGNADGRAAPTGRPGGGAADPSLARLVSAAKARGSVGSAGPATKPSRAGGVGPPPTKKRSAEKHAKRKRLAGA